jgi:hypothetical protein
MGGSHLEVSPGTKAAKPSLKNKLGMVAHTCDPSYSGREGLVLRPGLAIAQERI